ncbi:hypothetical protein ACNKHT_12170 [Shigella flexneri]
MANAVGIGAVKYADLQNRTTDYILTGTTCWRLRKYRARHAVCLHACIVRVP